MSSIIKQHNTKILSNSNNIQNRLCNCRNRNDCPLNGNCLKKCFVYKAEVTTDQSLKIYFGASEGEFKSRYNNHTLSFRNEHHANDTELSNHLWELKTTTGWRKTLKYDLKSFMLFMQSSGIQFKQFKLFYLVLKIKIRILSMLSFLFKLLSNNLKSNDVCMH